MFLTYLSVLHLFEFLMHANTCTYYLRTVICKKCDKSTFFFLFQKIEFFSGLIIVHMEPQPTVKILGPKCFLLSYKIRKIVLTDVRRMSCHVDIIISKRLLCRFGESYYVVLARYGITVFLRTAPSPSYIIFCKPLQFGLEN